MNSIIHSDHCEKFVVVVVTGVETIVVGIQTWQSQFELQRINPLIHPSPCFKLMLGIDCKWWLYDR